MEENSEKGKKQEEHKNQQTLSNEYSATNTVQ